MGDIPSAGCRKQAMALFTGQPLAADPAAKARSTDCLRVSLRSRVGILPSKVTAENGPVRVGDLLVASSTAGHAMKGTDRSRMLGAVVGKALEPLLEGNGVINVLVTLQ